MSNLKRSSPSKANEELSTSYPRNKFPRLVRWCANWGHSWRSIMTKGLRLYARPLGATNGCVVFGAILNRGEL
ncbi:hypothetical protein BJX65DRAFT_290638 [Aspergillus insuetus]